MSLYTLLLDLLRSPITVQELVDATKIKKDHLDVYLSNLRREGLIKTIGRKRINYRYVITNKGLLKLYGLKLLDIVGG